MNFEVGLFIFGLVIALLVSFVAGVVLMAVALVLMARVR